MAEAAGRPDLRLKAVRELNGVTVSCLADSEAGQARADIELRIQCKILTVERIQCQIMMTDRVMPVISQSAKNCERVSSLIGLFM